MIKDEPKTMHSLFIQGGHIIDPSQGMNRVGSLLISEGLKGRITTQTDISSSAINSLQRRKRALDCIFIFWTKGKKILERHQNLARTLHLALRDSFDLGYYRQAYKILENEEIVRNNLLKDISMQLDRNVFREGVAIEVGARDITLYYKAS